MINSFEYGKALYMLGAEEGIEEKLAGELDVIAKVFNENPDYVKLLDSPAISKAEKHKLLDEAFSAFHIYVTNFAKIICDKQAVYMFDSCRKGYYDAYDRAAGIVRATAITAVAMSKDQMAAVVSKLEKKSGKKVVLENVVDPGVIGGVRLRYSGVQLDKTVSASLEAMRRALACTSV